MALRASWTERVELLDDTRVEARVEAWTERDWDGAERAEVAVYTDADGNITKRVSAFCIGILRRRGLKDMVGAEQYARGEAALTARECREEER